MIIITMLLVLGCIAIVFAFFDMWTGGSDNRTRDENNLDEFNDDN
ncbi:hypothetical protein NRK67_04535 [Fusobacteria bacterium ZRK30]|nr:hypothetical protein NRK67_04535 [Fusobacteria bacterium ZRK30]